MSAVVRGNALGGGGELPQTTQVLPDILREIKEELIPTLGVSQFDKVVRGLRAAGGLRHADDGMKLMRTLEELPDNLRADYVGMILTPLAGRGLIQNAGEEAWRKTAQNFRSIAEDDIPPEHGREFTRAVGRLVEVGGLDREEDWGRLEGILDKIPPGGRADITEHVAEMVREGVLETEGDWRSFCKALDMVPKNARTEYGVVILSEVINAGGIRSGQWDNFLRVAELMPKDQLNYYASRALTQLLNAGTLKTQGDWDNYALAMESVSEEDRLEYTLSALPELFKAVGERSGPRSHALSIKAVEEENRPWSRAFGRYVETLGQVPEEDMMDYTKDALPSLIRKGMLDTPEDWSGYSASLRLLPEELRTHYTGFYMARLEAGQKPTTVGGWEDAAEDYLDRLSVPENMGREIVDGVLKPMGISNPAFKPDQWAAVVEKHEAALSLIPAEERSDYTLDATAELIAAGGLRTLDEWDRYIRVLEVTREEERSNLTENILAPAVGFGGLKTPADWEGFRKVMERRLMPEEQLAFYAHDALKMMKDAGGLKTQGEWDKHIESMECIHPEGRFSFSVNITPELMRRHTLDNPDGWDGLIKCLKKIAPDEERGRRLDMLTNILMPGPIKSLTESRQFKWEDIYQYLGGQ